MGDNLSVNDEESKMPCLAKLSYAKSQKPAGDSPTFGLFTPMRRGESSLSQRRKLGGLQLSKKNMTQTLTATSASSFATAAVLDQYVIGEHIGSGFQGSVYRAIRKIDEVPMIVKTMLAKEEQNLNRAHSEIGILRRLKGHAHLA
jgi:serine/threonine protein kinase